MGTVNNLMSMLTTTTHEDFQTFDVCYLPAGGQDHRRSIFSHPAFSFSQSVFYSKTRITLTAMYFISER